MRIKTVMLSGKSEAVMLSGKPEDSIVKFTDNVGDRKENLCEVRFNFDDDTHYSIAVSDEMNKGVIGHSLIELGHLILKD